MQLDLGRLHVLVTEPQRDDRRLDAGLEELHGGAVTKGVGGDALGAPGRAAVPGDGNVAVDQVADGVGTERSASPGGEHRIVFGTTALSQPGLEDGDGVAGERRGAVLAALAVATDVGAGAEDERRAGAGR